MLVGVVGIKLLALVEALHLHSSHGVADRRRRGEAAVLTAIHTTALTIRLPVLTRVLAHVLAVSHVDSYFLRGKKMAWLVEWNPLGRVQSPIRQSATSSIPSLLSTRSLARSP